MWPPGCGTAIFPDELILTARATGRQVCRACHAAGAVIAGDAVAGRRAVIGIWGGHHRVAEATEGRWSSAFFGLHSVHREIDRSQLTP